MTLVDEFRAFLGSVKTSEGLSPDLRAAITVPTGLERALAAGLGVGRDVVVAGSAGGGKTHLLDVLRHAHSNHLPELVEWPDLGAGGGSFIWYVADATALDRDQRLRIFEERPRECEAVVVAINEGPLLDLAHELPLSPWRRAVELLHKAQSGVVEQLNDDAPVVLDVGGFDPVQADVPAKLLALPIVGEVIHTSTCRCEDERVCPRRRAWRLLENPELRSRVNDLLRVVNLSGSGVLFRDLWDFIADVVLGGSCDSSPPTSAWFWRIFFGSSAVSARLRTVADPALTVFPRAEGHLWHGDWLSEEIELLEGVELIPVNGRPPNAEQYRWLKSQLFFVVGYDSVIDLVRDQVDLQLAYALEQRRADEIVSAINRYMSYGVLSPPRQTLDLWIDMAVERRMARAEGQVALGEVPTSELEVRRSIAVINHPDAECTLDGARYFLVHPPSSASFSLSPDVLNLLRGGRSYRTSDRPHTDMEWHLTRFFIDVGRRAARVDELRVMELNFKSMEAGVRGYRAAYRQGQIEPIGTGR